MNTEVIISLVCPTKNRPAFVEQSLKFFSLLEDESVELIIVDNSSSNANSTQEVWQNQNDQRVRYVRTGRELNMVDNWEFALTHATGQYIGFLTDKMFVLPGAFREILNYLNTAKPEILSWHADAFTPKIAQRYFGAGIYSKGTNDQHHVFKSFNPYEELRERIKGYVPRNEMLAKDYCRGKICFGLYSKELISQITTKYGRLFSPISPDYTSMVFALGTATTAVECNFAAVVHVNTDLSNGNLISLDDKLALAFLETTENYREIIDNLPIPMVYMSINNLVLYDYLNSAKVMGLSLDISLNSWMQQIFNDVHLVDRKWSSDQIKVNQESALNFYFKTNSIQVDFQSQRNGFKYSAFDYLGRILPLFLKNYYRVSHNQGRARKVSNIHEVI